MKASMNSTGGIRSVIRALCFVVLCCIVAPGFTQVAPQSLTELKTQYSSAKKAAQNTPGNLELAWQYGHAAAELGKASNSRQKLLEAISVFSELLVVLPGNGSVQLSIYDSYAYLVATGHKRYVDELHASFERLGPDQKGYANPPSYLVLLARLSNPRDYGDHRLDEFGKDELYLGLLVDALGESPGHVHTRAILSDLYVNLDYKRSAMAIAADTAARAPENADALMTVVNLLVDNVLTADCPYAHTDEIEKIVDVARRAAKIEYENIDAHRALRDAYLLSNQFVLAQMEASYVTQAPAANEYDLIDLVHLHNLRGQWDKAQLLLESAKLDGFTDADFQRQMGALWRGEFAEVVRIIESGEMDSAYDYLRLGLAREELGEAGGLKRSASEAVAAGGFDAWETELARFVSGEIEYAALLESAQSQCNRVEAGFYHGYTSMLQGRDSQALQLFEQVIESDLQAFYEYQMSRRFLERLRQG